MNIRHRVVTRGRLLLALVAIVAVGVPSAHANSAASVATFTGTHYLYADEGNGPWDSKPDNIEVFSITSSGSSHQQTKATGANQTIGLYGSNTLAIAPQNSKHGDCLLLADYAGFVDSFSILANHRVSSEVSHLADPISGGTPGDVHVSTSGNLAYVADVTSSLSSWHIGAGCVLTAASTVSAGGGKGYYNLAPVNATRLVAPDENNSTIDTFSLTSTGGMTLLNSVQSQVPFAGGVTVSSGGVFTGSTVAGPPSYAEAGQYVPSTGAVTFINGSPASDPTGHVGAAVLFDPTNRYLIEGNAESGTLANYSVLGSPPTLAFTSETPLAVAGGFPDQLTVLGATLIVNGRLNGDIEACQLTSGGASGCTTLVTLVNTGKSNGLIIK